MCERISISEQVSQPRSCADWRSATSALRHTHATLGLEAGIPPKVMQERLGHSSITMTMDLYSHVVPGMQKDAASRIAALIDAAG